MVEVSKDGLEAAHEAYSVEWDKVPDGTHAFTRAKTAALAAIATLQAERDRYRVALVQIGRCGNAPTDYRRIVGDIARTALSDAPVQS
ncbi:MAG TPA: hypothetical protein VF638_00860 [Sphingomonas sp.]|jgi:hypothetical protein